MTSSPALRPRRAGPLAGLALLLAACGGGAAPGRTATTAETARPAAFTPVTAALVDTASAAGTAWPVHGGAFANQRYSTLDAIGTSNVSRLRPAWIQQTGVAGAFQTTPIVVGNVLYLTTPGSHVIALNAASGEKLWEYAPHTRPVPLCCGPNNRGVAAWGERVFVATLDGHVIALDHHTGRVDWDAPVADSIEGASITMAPLAADGRVIVGLSGGEYGIRGRVIALDAQTGQILWTWYTIPSPGEAPNGWWGSWSETDPFGASLHRDIAREKADSADYPGSWVRGGGPVSTTPAYDPASHTLFVSVGSPSPDLDGGIRPGDNLYTGSVVALDATAGTLRWFTQLVPHDLWDMSPVSAPFLATVDGHRYVAVAGKTGWLYVLDAATGHPVLRSDNYVAQENLFAPPTPTGTRMLPGANGGTDFSPPAYSPLTRHAYVVGSHQPMAYTVTPFDEQHDGMRLGGTFRYLPGEDQWGVVAAIDLATGRIAWEHRLPEPVEGGALATAGGLVFVGQGSGALDAFDARSGNLLWRFDTGAGIAAPPITFAVGGVQYVVVAAGGSFQLGTPMGDALLAFTLDGRAPKPPLATPPAPRFRHSGPLTAAEIHRATTPTPPASPGPIAPADSSTQPAATPRRDTSAHPAAPPTPDTMRRPAPPPARDPRDTTRKPAPARDTTRGGTPAAARHARRREPTPTPPDTTGRSARRGPARPGRTGAEVA